MSNYSVSKVKFESLGRDESGCKETFLIKDVKYTADYNKDPEYMEDNAIGKISCYQLLDSDGGFTDLWLAFDKNEEVAVEDINEWSDEFDSDNPYVLEFN